MHPTNTALPGRNDALLRKVNALETLIRRGWFIQFYDPHGTRHGLPTYPYHFAPDGLATIRQLRAKGLRPGGQDIAAQILWRHRTHRRVAYLYRLDLAKPKRQATPAQLTAIAKALRARRICPTCEAEKPYYIPRSTGECNDCTARWAQ
ncbi:MAG TPA: RRQRL motif-containing zinc-binding protein [Streptosporangiaceae bacterium]|nr:RRQRL motif-containing zinc-binding protein [Streptosporangiaceae bacterium]